MSQTETSEKRGFLAAPAKPLPRRVCVGYVTGVGEVARSKSSDRYIVAPINITPYGDGNAMKAYFCYRPEQLVTGFDPQAYETAVDENDQPLDEKLVKSFTFTYGKNIAMRDSVSLLQGVCGSEEAFATLANELIVDEVESWEASMARVQTVLTNFFNQNVTPSGQPAPIGYVLDQQQEKTNQVGEDGKAIYVKTGNYNISTWFYPTEKTLKAWIRKAEGSGGKTKIMFDLENGVPF